MNKTAIIVENLSKQYMLRHQQASNYTALRDVLIDRTRSLVGRGSRSSKRETFLALDDLNFSIQAGDRVGVLGRNGAGKSTLLKVLSRIVAPTKGRVTINGRLSALLEVGTGFNPELTGRENIYLNGSILGMTKAEITKRFDEIVAFAEVERFLDTPVKRYSSGMYVRLAFAVAAHLEPEILIVDEVLAVGDAAFQKKCLGRMRDVAGEGRTVIFVSHNMDAVQKLCNTGILLHKGQLVTNGSINHVVRYYLDQHAADQAIYDVDPPADPNISGFIQRICIETIDGKANSEIPALSPWRVRIHVKINRNLEHFIAGFGIATLMEQPVRTVWSVPQKMTPGEYEMIINFTDVHLSPGTYKLVIGLSEHVRSFHYVDNLATFEIADATEVQPDDQIINYNSGLFLNQLQVETRRLN